MIRCYKDNMFAVVLLLCGLLVLTFACEQEDMPGTGGKNPDPQTGEPVLVNFIVSEMGFGENEITIRNTSPNPSEGGGQETVVIPVSEDIFMYATLTEDKASVNLRSLSPLDENSKVRVVAYSIASGENSGYADYEVKNDGSLNPTSHPLFVSPGTYNFVAYSFHNADPLAIFADTTAQLSTSDVLWGETTPLAITPENSFVQIGMKHLSSQVTMKVALEIPEAGFLITGITNANVSSFEPTRLIVKTGKLLLNTSTLAYYPFSWDFSGSGHPWIDSSPQYVYMNGQPLSVQISSISVDGASYSINGYYPINFSTPLQAGKSYTINVNFLRGPSGNADILYVIGDSLCVGRWGVDTKITANNILYFKFGSLIGFTAPTSGTSWSSSLVVLYVPRNSINTNNYGNIPGFAQKDYKQNTGRQNISDDYHNTPANITDGKGDPCKLVGLKASTARGYTSQQIIDYNSGWRLATVDDNINFLRAPTSWLGSNVDQTLSNTNASYWAALNSQNGGWFPIPGNRQATTGRTQSNTNPNGFLPAAGSYNTSGTYQNRNTWGEYWSSEIYTTQAPFCLRFDNVSVHPMGSLYHQQYQYALPVRCVKK